jgi:hypothetical protein
MMNNIAIFIIIILSTVFICWTIFNMVVTFYNILFKINENLSEIKKFLQNQDIYNLLSVLENINESIKYNNTKH